MNLVVLSPRSLQQVQPILVRFVRQQGERRIDKQDVNWLDNLTPATLADEETALVVALDGKRLAGVFAVARCGLTHSLLVVDRRYRGRGIGRALAARMCRLLPKLYVRVAVDNEPSLALFHRLGFQPVKARIAPTEKPTLWLAFGGWSAEDLEQHAG
ncbi:GNAT family N-acetyltransferase [Brevibacillus thermoruber]|jgi:ribosomal protein S18 acetylase RimI-like enzyme|uniref:GNAT family N-acetyltransferase n=1 Tax=Brevibacillus thermoruber TaxID=33942 RepID=UPI0005524974|nr:GNAT family N-acetyltransferase [Brevibacillus thermoruber]